METDMESWNRKGNSLERSGEIKYIHYWGAVRLGKVDHPSGVGKADIAVCLSPHEERKRGGERGSREGFCVIEREDGCNKGGDWWWGVDFHVGVLRFDGGDIHLSHIVGLGGSGAAVGCDFHHHCPYLCSCVRVQRDRGCLGWGQLQSHCNCCALCRRCHTRQPHLHGFPFSCSGLNTSSSNYSKIPLQWALAHPPIHTHTHIPWFDSRGFCILFLQASPSFSIHFLEDFSHAFSPPFVCLPTSFFGPIQ